MTQGPVVIPSCIDDVTPAWLTTELGRSVDDAVAQRIAEDSGFASLLYRVRLSGDPGLPETVIVKLPGTPEARGAMEMLGGYRRELEFYRRVAGRAPMGTPEIHVAEMGSTAGDFVLVMEDLAGWENADHLAGLTVSQARTAISGLAGLHSWPGAADIPSGAFPSMDTPLVRDLFFPVFGLAWPVYREHAREPVPPRVARFAERFPEYAAQALDVLGRSNTLLHGDIRADNLFFAGDEMKVVDFQFASTGAGASDVAYLVSQGLPTSARRGHDEELLREYLAQLTVGDCTFDQAWRDYRMATAYLIVLPVITLMGWDALPERSRQLCLTLTQRAVATIDETDALEVFA